MAIENGKGTVKVANGAGNTPVEVEWQQGDTVATILKRADITIQKGQTATLGNKRVRKPEKTSVEAGAIIVIAGKVSNG